MPGPGRRALEVGRRAGGARAPLPLSAFASRGTCPFLVAGGALFSIFTSQLKGAPWTHLLCGDYFGARPQPLEPSHFRQVYL